MSKKTFLIDAVTRTITPESNHISKSGGDQAEWIVTQGDARVEFSAPAPLPVVFTHGPQFSSGTPAMANGELEGEHTFTVVLLGDKGPKKEQESLQACLIVDP